MSFQEIGKMADIEGICFFFIIIIMCTYLNNIHLTTDLTYYVLTLNGFFAWLAGDKLLWFL